MRFNACSLLLLFVALLSSTANVVSSQPSLNNNTDRIPANKNIFGMGIYNDTPGSPDLSLQLPVARNLTGPDGWVLLFFQFDLAPGAAGPVPTSWQLAALEQAYSLGLRPVVRLGQWQRNYRDYSDDANHLIYKNISQSYVAFARALLAVVPPSTTLNIQLLNEPNICMEWSCSAGAGKYIDFKTIATEFASFSRDVTAAFMAWKMPYIAISIAPIAGIGFTHCECVFNGNNGPQNTNGTLFLQAMIDTVPDVYGNSDVFNVHPYPSCGDQPYDDWCAKGWLASYRQLYDIAIHSWRRNPNHHSNTAASFPIIVTETGWPAPNNESGKAEWMVQAFTDLFMPDTDIIGVMPFLMAGNFWLPTGWPWTVWDNSSQIVETFRPEYLSIQRLRSSRVTHGATMREPTTEKKFIDSNGAGYTDSNGMSPERNHSNGAGYTDSNGMSPERNRSNGAGYTDSNGMSPERNRAILIDESDDNDESRNTETMPVSDSVSESVSGCSDPSLFPGLAIVALNADTNETSIYAYNISDFTNHSETGPWSLQTDNVTAEVALSCVNGTRSWQLTVSSPQRLEQVAFPYVNTSTMRMSASGGLDMVLRPWLGGVFHDVKQEAKFAARVSAFTRIGGIDQNADFLGYPGPMHAPYVLLCGASLMDDCIVAAATTWPPKQLMPTAAPTMSLEFMDGVDIGTTGVFSIVLDRVLCDTSTGMAAWQKAILTYRDWLLTHVSLSPTHLPTNMVLSEGMVSLGLQNMASFNLTSFNNYWNILKGHFGRMQLWGQMSNYAGPPALAHPPLLPGEATGCCLLNQTMHGRYIDAGLPQWALEQSQAGYKVGYYTRPKKPISGNETWMTGWLAKLQDEYHGNAQYVDTFARVFEGDIDQVLPFVTKTFPADVIVEGWTDVYPFPGLLSGYQHGITGLNGGNNTEIYDLDPFSGKYLNGTFISMVRLLMGDAVGYFGYVDDEYMHWGQSNDYFSERLGFLLGTKVETGSPTVRNATRCASHTHVTGAVGDVGAGDIVIDPVLVRIKALRDGVRWWQRGFRYLDTIGVGNRHRDVIDVRRFDDRQGNTVLVVDNFQKVAGLTVTFRAATLAVPSDPLSIIEI